MEVVSDCKVEGDVSGAMFVSVFFLIVFVALLAGDGLVTWFALNRAIRRNQKMEAERRTRIDESGPVDVIRSRVVIRAVPWSAAAEGGGYTHGYTRMSDVCLWGSMGVLYGARDLRGGTRRVVIGGFGGLGSPPLRTPSSPRASTSRAASLFHDARLCVHHLVHRRASRL